MIEGMDIGPLPLPSPEVLLCVGVLLLVGIAAIGAIFVPIAAVRRLCYVRFSLRTLFVTVTALCAGLGWITWQWRMVQEREEVEHFVWRHGSIGLNWGPGSWDDRRTLVPWVRRMLGDRARGPSILLSHETSQHDFEMVRRTFPESNVERGPPPLARP